MGSTVYSTPPTPAPPEPGLVFPVPDPGERFGPDGMTFGYGGYGLEFVARAETGPDARPDRALAGVIDGKLVVRDTRTGALTAIPVDGGAPSALAAAVPADALIAGDARGIYWAAGDGSIRQAPDRLLASVPGRPRFVFIDATDIHVVVYTVRSPGDMGTTFWAIPRAGGAPRALAELPDRDGVLPDQPPVAGADGFYYVHGRNVLRLSKGGGLARIAEVSETLVAPEKRGIANRLSVLLVDGGFVYLKAYPYCLVRVPIAGGAATVITENVSGDDLGLWAAGDRLYLSEGGSIHVAPRGGGTWRPVASTSRPVRAVFERRGKLYVLDDRALVRVDPIVQPERRLVHDDLYGLAALAGHGPDLYYTISETTPEIWSVPKRGGPPRLVTRTPRLTAAPVFDGDFIYLLDEDGSVLRAPLGGGPPTDLVKRNPSRASLERAYDREDQFLPRALGVDGRFVYWLDPERGALLRVQKSGGATQAAAQGLRGPIELAVGDGFAVVETTDGRKSTLVRIPLAPAGPAQPIATADDRIPFAVVGRDLRWAIGDQVLGQTAGGAPFPLRLSRYSRGARVTDLVFDADTIVLASARAGIYSQSPGRDAVRVLAEGHDGPSLLILDGRAVFFADTGSMQMHKTELMRSGCCSIWAAPR
ncbi:MAG TPA: hypothetical protein VIF57_18385 [Polyangia bacterium]